MRKGEAGMGAVFRYIADEALAPENPDDPGRKCDVCKKNSPAYRSFGRAVPARRKNEVRIDAACADCFREGRVREVRDGEEVVGAVRTYVAKCFKKESAARRKAREAVILDELNRMPCRLPPFRQRLDWPLCCRGLTEFVGSPAAREELKSLPPSTGWDLGELHDLGAVDFREMEGTDVLHDTGVFRCPTCARLYVVFQPT
jgi:hypothetical protein